MVKYIGKVVLGEDMYHIKDIEARANLIDKSEKGAANGVATLDANGKVPSSLLPSYVDDVLEYESSAEFPVTGESSKIYVDLLTNKTYRWGGSDYVEISESLALGETSSTAYRGDRGKATADAFNAHAADTDIHVTAAKQAAWDAKSDFSGSYNNLTDKPTTLNGYGITDAYTKTEVNGLVDTPHQEYVTVNNYASLPATGSADTIYRVSNYNGSTSQVDPSVYSEYAWNGTHYIFLCVKSQIGEVFDISVYNNNAKYADLVAALNGGANIPQSLLKGGMSVKFIQSSDNKYVQYRLMSDSFNTTVSNWQGVDDEPIAGSDNMVTSRGLAEFYGTYKHNNQEFIDVVADKKGRILLGIYKNGDVFISGLDVRYEKDALNRMEILTDNVGNILSYRTKDGTLVEYDIKSQTISTEDIDLGEKGKEYIRNLFGGAASSDVLTDPDDWDIPQNNSNKLAVVRSDGMTRLTWTPKKDVPTLNGNVRQAGNLVHGIPYGATYEEDKCVGFDVSIETFMTAVNNPYSLLYTERCGKGSLSSSIWGKTYHGIDGYTGPYFGSVCSEFTSYCLGLNSKTYSGDLKGFNRNASIGKVHPTSSQGVRVGDIYYKNGHCTLIKAVKRNEVGTVVGIIVAEQNGTTYETLYTADEFDEMIATDMESRPPVVIYRDISLERGTDVSTFDDDNYQYNNDICTFAGDKACFRENELIVINYNLENNPSHDWTAIELYKNDALLAVYQINEIDQTELPEGQRGHAIKFADGLTYGHYKARLTNGSSFSDYTSFDVIQTNVNVSGIQNEEFIDCGNVLDVSFSSMNARPIALKLSMASGSIQRAFYNFTDYEITNGRAIIDVNYLIEQQKDREGGIKPNTLYGVRIVFETAYGRVANKDINIKFNY